MAVRSPYEPQIESLEALLAKRELTTELLCDEAREFSEMESTHGEPDRPPKRYGPIPSS